MRIESLSLVSDIMQTPEGDLLPALPALESFVLGNKPYIFMQQSAVQKEELFYVFMHLRYPAEDGGKRLLFEGIIEDPQGDIIPFGPLKPNWPLPMVPREGTYKQTIPVQVNFRIAGAHTLRVTIRDISGPDGTILDRKTVTFAVTPDVSDAGGGC